MQTDVAMLEITPTLQIPDDEFTWTFACSGGPGGQNVNKVASKAALRWHIAASSALPEEVKIRLALQQKRFFTQDGELFIVSQRYRGSGTQSRGLSRKTAGHHPASAGRSQSPQEDQAIARRETAALAGQKTALGHKTTTAAAARRLNLATDGTRIKHG